MPIIMSESELRPNFSGVWELNLEKSVLRGPAPKRILMRIEHREPKLVQRILVTYADGREMRMAFAYETGTSSENSVGGMTVKTQARWEGRELALLSTAKSGNGEQHYKDYWSLSEDRQTLTMEHRNDDLAGQISILERTSSGVGEFDR
jgi:hypothetical protein